MLNNQNSSTRPKQNLIKDIKTMEIMETEAHTENCLHTPKELAEAEVSENVQEQVAALLS